MSYRELDFGIKCVAMPIFDRNRNLYAAISISGLASHFTEEKLSLQMRWQFFLWSEKEIKKDSH